MMSNPGAPLSRRDFLKLAALGGDAGTVPFLCDIFCGSGHEQMNGVILVG